MTQGTGPARRDLWGEQGLRPAPGTHVAGAPAPEPAPAPATSPATSPASAPRPTTGTAPAPLSPAALPPHPGAAPDTHATSAPPPPPDDESTRIDGDVLDRARERRDRPGRRRLRLVGAGAALALVGGGTWAVLRDEGPPAPPLPAPTLAAEDLRSLVSALESTRTSEGVPVIGPLPDVLTADPRRADLLQPADPVDVTLRSAKIRWTMSPTDLLGDAAADLGATDADLANLSIVPARRSATVADASSPTAVVVVRRGAVSPDLWGDLLAEAGWKGTVPEAGGLVVGVDVAKGAPRWVHALSLASSAPCQVLDAGSFVACDSADPDDNHSVSSREIVVLATETGKVDVSVTTPVGCTLSSIAQHTGVLYWAGRENDSACFGSGTTLMGGWTSRDDPTIAATTDGRVLVRTTDQSAVRSADGTWRTFAGSLEPGPDGTVLRTFLREELRDLSPLTLRDASGPDGSTVVTRYITLVTAEDGTTIGALPGAAWRRDDLVTGTGVTTPSFLEGRSGVGDWLVTATGARERLVHAGDERFLDGLAPWVVEGGVVGGTMSPDATTSVLMLDGSGKPVAEPGDAAPRSVPYAGGWVGPGLDDAAAEPVPGVEIPSRAQEEGLLAMNQHIEVIGSDGTKRTTEAVIMLETGTSSSSLPQLPPLWLGTGGVVVLPLGSSLVGIG